MARRFTYARVELNEDTVQRFKEMYPNAIVSSTLSLLFEKFMEVTTHSPKEYIQIAAEAIKEDLGR